MENFKRLRCKRIYGIWFYRIIKPTYDNNLDANIIEAFRVDKKDGGEFGSYGDLKYYVETGKIL